MRAIGECMQPDDTGFHPGLVRQFPQLFYSSGMRSNGDSYKAGKARWNHEALDCSVLMTEQRLEFSRGSEESFRWTESFGLDAPSRL